MNIVVFPVVGPTKYCGFYGDPREHGPHRGVDICAPMSTPVLAINDGSVSFGTDPMGGLVAVLRSSDGSAAYFAHLSAYEGRARRVSAGDVIGYVGMTGNAATTLPHLHIELWPTGVYTDTIDPLPQLKTAQRFLSPPTTISRLTTGQAVVAGAGILAFAGLLGYVVLSDRPLRLRARWL